MLSVLFLFVTCCFGAIWDCPRPSYRDIFTLHINGARDCAEEGGYCYTGPGTYYYGQLSSWSVKTVTTNSVVPCNNEFFGCDPLPLIKKSCLKADRFFRVDNQHIDEYKPLPSPTPVPECVPEGGTFEGDNDFCSMALVQCQPSDQYVYWSKPDCGCGCKPVETAYDLKSGEYQKYYKSEKNSNSNEYGMQKDYKPEPQYTSNNGEYIQNGYEMNAYPQSNRDNSYNSYWPKDGDKSGYASSSTDEYDNGKYKKYYNDEPKDNLNDYKKNYRISDSVIIPVSDKPIIDTPITSAPVTSSPDSADGIFPDNFPLTTDESLLLNKDSMVSMDEVDAGNELMNVDDAENTSFEDKLKEYSGVLALIALICTVLISLVLFMKICCGCCNRERAKGQIVADEEEDEDLGIDDV